jgi:hypothetical protein
MQIALSSVFSAQRVLFIYRIAEIGSVKDGVAQTIEVRVRHENRALREQPRQPRPERAHGAGAHRPDVLHDLVQHRLFDRLQCGIITFNRLKLRFLLYRLEAHRVC